MIADHNRVKKSFGPMNADHDLAIMDAEVSTHTFLTMIIEESVCFMSCEPIFFGKYSYVVHTEYIYIFFYQLNIAHER